MTVRLPFIMLISCIVTAAVPAGQHTPRTPHAEVIPRALTIQFRHIVGSRELALFNETYSDPFGEPMTITRFRYYVSHIRVTDEGHREWRLSDRSYLIDEAVPSSKTLTLSYAGPAIQSVSFDIGVDSILNVSGVQTGDLDPLKGMFWTWNSGYIFAKLEGRSDSSSAPAHYFNWDIGGFKSPANAARKITVPVPAHEPGAAPVIVIEADLLKWWDGMHPIRISQHPLCHQPGFLAMQIADNYSTMFSIRP